MKMWLYDGEEETIKEFCNCGSAMKCNHQFSHVISDDEDPYYLLQTFKILTCPGCESVTVILYKAYGDSDEYEPGTKIEGPLSREYTRHILYAPRRSRHGSIPQSISDVVNQAEGVMANSPRACFILCRAALEEICNDHDIPTEEQNKKGKLHFIDLKDRLNLLFEQQQINGDLQSIMEGVKNLGNKGAHSAHRIFSKQVSLQDAENLLGLVNYIIGKIYVDKAREEEAVQTLQRLKEKILSSHK